MRRTTWHSRSLCILVAVASGVTAWTGCGEPEADNQRTAAVAERAFESFKLSLPNPEDGILELGDGSYIVEHDIPLADENALKSYFLETYIIPRGHGDEPSPTMRRDGLSAINKWSDEDKGAITYCIAPPPSDCNSIKEKENPHEAVKQALLEATSEWQKWATTVKFQYTEMSGAACDKNSDVKFHVQIVCSSEEFAASSFKPICPREKRVLKVNWTKRMQPQAPDLKSLMLHEVGHALGFIHEGRRNTPQTLLELYDLCSDENTIEGARDLTPYDIYSVMHQRRSRCPNSSPEFIQYKLTSLDQLGARCLYDVGDSPPVECQNRDPFQQAREVRCD